MKRLPTYYAFGSNNWYWERRIEMSWKGKNWLYISAEVQRRIEDILTPFYRRNL